MTPLEADALIAALGDLEPVEETLRRSMDGVPEEDLDAVGEMAAAIAIIARARVALVVARARIGAGDNPRSIDLVPETIRRSLLAYANEGTPVGGFLEAVLTGDLYRACRNADGENVRCIPAIVAYVDSELPGDSYGSKERYGEWVRFHVEVLEGKRCPECLEELDTSASRPCSRCLPGGAA